MEILNQVENIQGAREPLLGAGGAMNALLSPWTLAAACMLISLGLMASSNAALWAVSLLALPVAVWLAGKQAYRVLLWVIAVNWLQVIGDVVAADLTGNVLSGDPYRVQAIVWSLCAILALALGMRFGTALGMPSGMRLGKWLFGPAAQAANTGSVAEGERGVSLNRVVIGYLISLLVTTIVGSVATSVPALAQPVLALKLIKFVFVYLVAAKVFESGRGYGWLVLLSFAEMVIGMVGYFSSYKEAFIVILIALASSRRPVSARMWIFGAAAVVAVVWASLAWTTVKKEYRLHVAGEPIAVELEWMTQRILVDSIDYGDAVMQLFQRIGYTELYGRVIARENIGSLSQDFNFYASAVQHVLTPRFLFPDKATLNDSKLTTALLGMRITGETSIGVGYVAQAHADFGFPGLLLAILSIGIMIGVAAKYFMTRTIPLLIREAFTTAALFLAFPFEENIDKALGGFITGCLAMALVLKFAYPMIASWLTRPQASRRVYSDRSIKVLPT
jgi:hypothetical protein